MSEKKEKPVYLGGGFSCLVCCEGFYPGYSRVNDRRSLPCPSCGYDAPARMSHKAFRAFIKWRDKLGGAILTSNHERYAAALGCRPRQIYKFSQLAKGARFSYPSIPGRVWVKLDSDTVAAWDDDMITATWIGQSLCSAAEQGQGDFDVILRD